jgi:UDP-GlcNAc:undecaprenyl-phosphate/decaprenyl-phosphate GlcNAc-1-phosphate transferase
MVFLLLLALVVSFGACWVLVFLKQRHMHVSCDAVDSGPQKFHACATPRIGGIPIMLGLLAGCIGISFNSDASLYVFVVLSLLPVWLFGMIEDFTKQVSPLHRLLAAFVVALLGVWLMDARLLRLDVPGLDLLLNSSFIFSVMMTMLMVGGITHSINIIDGFNGLASGVVLMVLSALAYVTYQLNDMVLFNLCIVSVGATLGFFVWNYPRGLIFAGDGGAYLWGALIAEIILLLLVRHPEVSPWFGFLLLVHPIWETLFTIYRRKFIRGVEPGLPDAIHLHSLVYRRLVRTDVSSKSITDLTRRNSSTAPYLWGLESLAIVPALMFWNNPSALFICAIAFIVFYCVVYRMIVHFKVWRWLVIH